MEVQTWIISQIGIDIIIAILILWVIKSHLKGKKSVNNNDSVFRETEIILSEMRQLSLGLDKNLKEKKEISRNILDQLDDGLKRADETLRQVKKTIKEFSTLTARSEAPLKDADRIRESVNSLLAKGLSREEIARCLGISVAEIELLIKFQDRIKSPKTPFSSSG